MTNRGFMNVTSVRCECLRGVWLGNTGPSLPRLLPNPLSAPTTHSYAPRRKPYGNMGRDRSSWTGKHPDGVISHQSPRANVTRTDHGRILSSKILGGHTEDRMFRNIRMTKCSSPVSLSECTSRNAAVSVRDSRLGCNTGAPGLPVFLPPSE